MASFDSTPPAPTAPSAPPGSPLTTGKKFQNWHEGWADCEAGVSQTTAVLTCTVSEPQTNGSYVNKYINYLVRTEPYTYLVRRRYSDFVWLRETLAKRYIGMLVPSLPPKTYSQSKGDDNSSHVKQRMRMLGLFLEKVVSIPYLRGDESLLAFLSVQQQVEWEQAQQVTAVPSLWNSSCKGSVNWRDALRSAEIPHNGARILMDFITQLDYLEGHLKKLVAGSTRVAEVTAKRMKDLQSFNDDLGEWAKTEGEFGNSAKFEYPNKDSENMAKLMNGSADTLKGWVGIVSFEPAIIDNVVCAFLLFLQQQVEAFKTLIKEKDAAIRDLQRCEKALSMKKDERTKKGGQTSASKGVFGGFGGKAETLDSAIEREEEEVVTKRRNVEAMARALFWSEIDRFNEDRRKVLGLAFSQLNASELMLAKKSQNNFQNFFETMGLDSGEESQKAKDMLQLCDDVDAVSLN